jgi:Putative zinc-finger
VSPAEPRMCKEVGALLVFYACGETNEQESTRVEKHLAACAACAAQLAEERSLHASLMDALQASEKYDTGGILLSQCRSELAEALDDLSAPPLKQSWRPFGWVRRSMVLRPILSGALLVLAGVAIGTQVVPRLAERLDSGAGAQTVRVLPVAKFTDEQLANMAVAGISLTPSGDGAGNLQVHVRTEQPQVLSGSVDDPEMRRVLTYVVENGRQSDPGVKLDCLDALRMRTSDKEVRKVLLYAAQNDQNPAVRMKAMDSLRDAATEPKVREMLMGAVEHDANPGVRVEAVNLLVRSLEASSPKEARSPEAVVAQTDVALLDASFAQVVHTLQELERNDPNPNVRVRSAAALRQIGPREVQ